MTNRDLEIFSTVAECQSMSRAAQLLYISPSSVSQAIAKIEADYSIHLFDRVGKKLMITDSGRVLLEYAHKILTLYAQMTDALTRAESTEETLRIGASPSVGALVLGNIIQSFYEELNCTSTKIVIDHAKAITSLVSDGILDLALVLPRPSVQIFEAIPLFEDELVLVCSPLHPFAERGNVSPIELQDVPLVLREKGSRTRAQLDQEFWKFGVRLREQWTSDSTQAIKQAAINNDGLAILSKCIVREELQKGTLKQITLDGCLLMRTFHMIYRRDRELSPPIDRFLNTARRYCRAHLN